MKSTTILNIFLMLILFCASISCLYRGKLFVEQDKMIEAGLFSICASLFIIGILIVKVDESIYNLQRK